jgi:hypothetical protein
MDGSRRGGCDDSALMVGDRATLLPCLRRGPRLSHVIAPAVATVWVPSPWSPLVSRGFAAARWAWATRALHASHSDPSAARVVKTVRRSCHGWLGCHGPLSIRPSPAVASPSRGPTRCGAKREQSPVCPGDLVGVSRGAGRSRPLTRGGASGRRRRRCRLWGGAPPEIRASPRACGCVQAHQRTSKMTRGADM